MLNEAPALAPLADGHCLTIRAEAMEVRRASLWLERLGREQAVPPEQSARLDLCLNEALGNILFHGGPRALAEPVVLQWQVRRQAGCCEAAVTVSDAGVKFDLLAAAPKVLPQSLDEAQPGGLGLLMLRQFTDELHYGYREGRNHLTFSVRWAVEPG